MSRKVTMQQIADSLGVSKFVVSKALAGKEGVSESTRERVIGAATQLGYFAQRNAYMKSIHPGRHPEVPEGKRQSVLVLMPNIRFQTKDSVYWGRILDGIAAKLEEEGCGMVIVSEQSVEHFAHFLNPNGILGLIGVGEISTPLLLETHRIGLPIVMVDHEDALIPCDTVFANNFESMYRLTQYLIGIGHRQLAFVGDTSYSRSFKDRYLGFRCALEDEGLWGRINDSQEDALITFQGRNREDFIEPVKSWCLNRGGNLPSAMLAANDMIAIGTIRALQSLGLSVPDDISVSGFDNIDGADLPPSLALTTVHVPKEALGRRAVELLIKRIGEKDAPKEKVLLACELLYRDSTERL